VSSGGMFWDSTRTPDVTICGVEEFYATDLCRLLGTSSRAGGRRPRAARFVIQRCRRGDHACNGDPSKVSVAGDTEPKAIWDSMVVSW
jgi:hypothetical protein